jgi:hypothetical protein
MLFVTTLLLLKINFNHMGSFTIGVSKMSVLGFERIAKEILDFYIVFSILKLCYIILCSYT